MINNKKIENESFDYKQLDDVIENFISSGKIFLPKSYIFKELYNYCKVNNDHTGINYIEEMFLNELNSSYEDDNNYCESLDNIIKVLNINNLELIGLIKEYITNYIISHYHYSTEDSINFNNYIFEHDPFTFDYIENQVDSFFLSKMNKELKK